MDKKKLQTMFRKFKKESGVAYAITNPDSLGDCQSCVNSALADKYGYDSFGVWVKHWNHGMNSTVPIEQLKRVYVAHDLNAETADKFIKIMSEEYHVYPKEFDHCVCFTLYEKETEVYVITYTDTMLDGTESTYTDTCYKEEAERKMKWLLSKGIVPNCTKLTD